MKFRCERDVLVDALATAGRAVSTRSGVPGLAGVRVELIGNTLTATGSDLDLTITTTIDVAGEADGVVVIPSRLAADIVKSLSPGAVSVVAEQESLQISAGRSDFRIRLISSDEFPQIQELGVPPVELDAAKFADALKQVVLAASSDDSRPILTGVLVAAEDDGIRLVATDSYRLGMCDIEGVSLLKEGEQVLVPSRALGEVNRILGQGKKIELQLGETEATFKVGQVRLATRLIEGDFPNYRGLLPESHPNTLTVNRQAFLEALRRVKLLAPQEGTPVYGPDGIVYPGTCNKPENRTGFGDWPMPDDSAFRLDMSVATNRVFQPRITGAGQQDRFASFTETGHGPNGETGLIEFSASEMVSQVGDVVLARRDMGTSYHLSVVLDDAFQGITHVVRGEDLFEATKIHVVLQRHLDLPTPVYHHHRLIRDDAGRRLAKRDDARAISKYRAEGATPEDIRRMVGL